MTRELSSWMLLLFAGSTLSMGCKDSCSTVDDCWSSETVRDLGRCAPKDVGCVFRVARPQLIDDSNYFYARLQMYQSDADDPAYRGAWARLNIWNPSRASGGDHTLYQGAVIVARDPAFRV